MAERLVLGWNTTILESGFWHGKFASPTMKRAKLQKHGLIIAASNGYRLAERVGPRHVFRDSPTGLFWV